MSEPILHRLPNGVRVLIEPVDTVRSAAIGLWCKTGSKDELDSEAGITHLIEHMLFKGTEHRTAKQIAEAIEGRGGALNAFTDKEATCYYARVLAEEVVSGVDVLTDMMLHSLFDAEELEREAQVVVEEIKRGEDEPSDQVHELHLSSRWGNHPLGKPIIGTRESVTSFRRDNLLGYMDRRYRAENVLLTVAGCVDPDALLSAAQERLGVIPSGGTETTVQRPTPAPKTVYQEKDVEQVHFCIGTEGCSLYDDTIYVLAVLDGALGGGMASRLFQEIREKRGLAYSVGSYPLSYTAGGAFTVYGGCSPQHWPKVQELVASEFQHVSRDGLESDELERIKLNLKGHLVMGLEGMSGRMMRNSRNQLFHNRFIPIEETIGKIEAVTNAQIKELAEKLLQPNLVSTTVIGPAGG